MLSEEGVAEEVISEDEQRLADQLKKLCTEKGREQKSKLPQSAAVLMKLGDLYIQKAVDAKDPMLQKLSLIKSCALLNAARVRFAATNNRTSEVTRLLEKFSDKSYDICAVEGDRKKSLPEISRHLYERVSSMREDVKSKLSTISRVTKSEANRGPAENRIIKDVQKLYHDTTENYKSLMSQVTEECLRLLGKPPCKFCQIGLGSMARKEITLYSDFEHVIALDDAVDKMDQTEREKVQEYFRWFAVLFQIIIIGLGETFVRSVGVKSINDLYSGELEKNWYYDEFTPCGMAFDGMVPHSCMNPLGRQNKTKNRKHKVEFIQPAKKMAEHLSSEQHLKNGYYIKDILARTCLAYGDQTVYDSFVTASKEILQSEHMMFVANDLSTKMAGNVNSYMRGARIALSEEEFDPKTTFYRPMTAQLAYLATFFEIRVSTSFEVIDELEKMKAIDVKVAHALRYAVAVTCKTRMEAYAVSGNQRKEKDSKQTVFEVFGTDDSTLIYKCTRYLVMTPALIAQEIGKAPKSIPDRRKILNDFNEKFWKDVDIAEQVSEMFDAGKLEEAITLGEKHLNSLKSKDDRMKLSSVLAACHSVLANVSDEGNRKNYHFAKMMPLCSALLKEQDLPATVQLDMHYCLSEAHEHKQNRKSTIEACLDYVIVYRDSHIRLEHLTKDGVATGEAYSLTVLAREKRSQYVFTMARLVGTLVEFHTPAQSLSQLFPLLVGEELHAARVLLCYGIAHAYVNSRFETLARISFSLLPDEFRAYPQELEGFASTISEQILELQKQRRWGNLSSVDANKISAVTLAQSAMLHEDEIAGKVKQCIEMCKRDPDDQDLKLIYAHAISVFAFRHKFSTVAYKDILLMLSDCPTSVRELRLLDVTMKKYSELVSAKYAGENALDKEVDELISLVSTLGPR